MSALRKLRARFFKKDRAKYISHLDLYRFMQRSFKRAGIDVWYTEGFNPHLYIMFPLPLSLGYESDCEIMDFNIIDDSMTNESIMEKMNAILPEGIQICKVYEPVMKHTEIAFSEYDICMIPGDEYHDVFTAEKFNSFMAQDQIIISKKTKQKTFKEVDIKPYSDILLTEDGPEGLHIILKMPSGNNGSYNPSLLTDAFSKYIGHEADLVKVRRTSVTTINGETFM